MNPLLANAFVEGTGASTAHRFGGVRPHQVEEAAEKLFAEKNPALLKMLSRRSKRDMAPIELYTSRVKA